MKTLRTLCLYLAAPAAMVWFLAGCSNAAAVKAATLSGAASLAAELVSAMITSALPVTTG